MEWVMFIIIIAMIASVSDKQDKLSKKIDNIKSDNNNKIVNKQKKDTLVLDAYLNKKVCIEIDNDDINNSYLFSSMYNTSGEIIDYDDEWLEFRYEDKSKHKIVNKFFRIRDIVSINEIE